MESPAVLLDSSNKDESNDEQAQDEDGAFHTDFHASDAAQSLQPQNLSIPKVRRAWERKPLSPFSRERVRVGKVWKRPVSSLRTAMSAGASRTGESGVVKRRRSRSPQKPVKKMCLDSSFGMGARVLQWEGAESPVRKIVTRSGAVNEAMVELAEEAEEMEYPDEDPNVIIEVLDEDGTLLDVDLDDDEERDDWEDEVKEVQDGDDVRSEQTVVSDDDDPKHTQHLYNAYNEGDDVDITLASLESTSGPEVDSPIVLEVNAAPLEVTNVTNEGGAMLQGHVGNDAADKVVLQPSRTLVLSDGFVSPVKRSVGCGERSAALAFDSRRRTLPVQFAPEIAVDPSFPVQSATPADVANDEEIVDAVVASDADASDPTADVTVQTGFDVGDQMQPEEDWEDVVDGFVAPEVLDQDEVVLNPAEDDMAISTALDPMLDDNALETTEQAVEDEDMLDMIVPSAGDDKMDPDVIAEPYTPSSPFQEMRSKFPSSPVPSIEGQHPRLPLRRSPRRKSTSPVKQSTTLPSAERPHLVAFTPLKRSGPAPYPSPSFHPGVDEPLDEQDTHPEPASPLQRAASAPLESPRMSPQKPCKPRVSDDTALLQAFLNRAAESKNSRDMSASTRESLTNRRDSDAVRQALASPRVQSDAHVLVELDVNSPSPRKAQPRQDLEGTFDEITRDAESSAVQDDGPEEVQTRRSGRATRKRSSPAVPNRISIRGNADGVVLKRTEAQGLALLVRNNTKKNKGGAVFPTLRLTKLVSQPSQTEESSQEEQPDEKPPGVKGVRWRQTLAEFFDGGEASETSDMSDDVSASAQLEQEVQDAAVAAPPAPQDTPSKPKPKIRRLKLPKTAGTPGKPSTAPQSFTEERGDKVTAAESQKQEEQKPKAVPADRRRSRIATPAKGLTNASLLPTDLDPQPGVPAVASAKKPTTTSTKKKAPTSRLPAPATSTAAAVLGQGKENNSTIISSPPKKKTSNVVPPAKTFAPKLDFGAKLKLGPVGGEGVPGLASPAKKGGRGRTAQEMLDGDEVVAGHRQDVTPGLSSPAKKRTRRAFA